MLENAAYMKPLKIFYVLLTTNLLVMTCAMVFPTDGLKIKNITLRFLNLQEWLAADTADTKNIAEVLPHFDLSQLSSDTSLLELSGETLEEDALTKIVYNETAVKEFTAFFAQAQQAKEGSEPLRVLHYGDSQIEGDRISSVVREQFQTAYGGNGAGMVPVNEPCQSRSSIQIKTSGNWDRKQVFGGPTSSKLANGEYGILGFSHRFSPVEHDSTTNDTAKAHLFLSPMYTAFKRASEYGQLKVLYRTTGHATMTLNGITHPLSAHGNVVLASQKVAGNRHEIEFANTYGLEIFALMVDGNSGVAVDNIAVRGSSGIIFSKMDKELLRSQYQQLNVGLIIYQFGVNVIPNVREEYSYYQKQVSNELSILKSLNPGVPVLVIGPSDMSRKEGSNYVSYPNIPLLIEAQKEAAMSTGCAFWDLHESMGGINSMPAWVNAQPALAQKDHVHFSPKGANVVGQKLFQAIDRMKYDLELLQ